MNDDPAGSHLDVIAPAAAAHGHLIHAAEADPGAGLLPFAYTSGLASSGHPELVIVGQPATVARPVLDALAAQGLGAKAMGGRGIGPGDMYPGIIRGAALAIVGPATAGSYLAGHADALSMDERPPLQVVWPDKSGLFPWQGGYDQSLRQPLLGPPPPGQARPARGGTRPAVQRHRAAGLPGLRRGPGQRPAR